ncbi:25S rRNA adenine-N 1 methyltransferase [Pyrenophora tritici-repentis]|uniref:25S rRNA adenine-N(1) methyltransferase n=1 Tax=Pyrenophora tritici-repentis TaxID=45151 RepID=A0A2W1E8H9_9PLEO|nr:25S rRNA adenine-N(1) methyltransferase [Pyrenophora tritici-repentis]KAF7454032.1 25S rRNA adenine-N methyltransferase [Pyrenophora tritici-repentis]KAF7577121.1 DUF3321 multi-domain protein [Pyrenophora tritici-repentis]KAG9387776.1 25S rRNA adenine-N methyltransferase [Pyrenophora tritici-repentis]KAI0581156.1 25S rRNA adenine-N(1) methyltransferase [Pyrenophora tritici-repentis]
MAVKKRQKTLSHGRPPISKPKERMTSERSRTIIRTHHRLQKEHAAALKKVEWLQESHVLDPKARGRSRTTGEPELRCLEVGALSTTNEISKYASVIQMTRIDLNSQGSGIEKQDFMERPLPTTDDERFDIISLSLVLNYVPDAVGRGEMLKRIPEFLRKGAVKTDEPTSALPALFFVLPLPCVDNSRYLDEELLLQIMRNLGFTMRYSKNTSKLCYFLFTLSLEPAITKAEKRKIRDGPGMNNFCVVVE